MKVEDAEHEGPEIEELESALVEGKGVVVVDKLFLDDDGQDVLQHRHGLQDGVVRGLRRQIGRDLGEELEELIEASCDSPPSHRRLVFEVAVDQL